MPSVYMSSQKHTTHYCCCDGQEREIIVRPGPWTATVWHHWNSNSPSLDKFKFKFTFSKSGEKDWVNRTFSAVKTRTKFSTWVFISLV